MPSPALLPCPFCGGEPLVLHIMGRELVKCSKCGVTTSAAAKDARRAWNRREGARNGD